MIKAGIIGSTGYAGMELVRLLMHSLREEALRRRRKDHVGLIRERVQVVVEAARLYETEEISVYILIRFSDVAS